MKKGKLIVFITLVFAVIAAGSMMDTSFAGKKPSAKKGKYLFKKQCKSCHVEGGETDDLTPISRTIEQWENYFKNDYQTFKEDHKGLIDKKNDGKNVLELNGPNQLQHIQKFLIKHAADSDQPQTCG